MKKKKNELFSLIVNATLTPLSAMSRSSITFSQSFSPSIFIIQPPLSIWALSSFTSSFCSFLYCNCKCFAYFHSTHHCTPFNAASIQCWNSLDQIQNKESYEPLSQTLCYKKISVTLKITGPNWSRKVTWLFKLIRLVKMAQRSYSTMKCIYMTGPAAR